VNRLSAFPALPEPRAFHCTWLRHHFSHSECVRRGRLELSWGWGGMDQIECTEVCHFVRKLRGGSQPMLAKASDGFYYVVKFFDNLQGANLCFNDALGTELFRQAGLPVPEWRPVCVSDEFLDCNPDCWMEIGHGSLRPLSGWCFASRSLGLNDSALFEILPRRSFARIKNRRDFWTSWVLDVLCGHSDNRQALFVEDETRSIEAYFIDHGHLFGGAEGSTSPAIWASRYLDPDVYLVPEVEEADRIHDALLRVDFAALATIVNGLPAAWKTPAALSRFQQFRRRWQDRAGLKIVVHSVLGAMERREGSDDRPVAQPAFGPERGPVYAQIPKLALLPRNDGRSGRSPGDQASRRSQTLCRSQLRTANLHR